MLLSEEKGYIIINNFNSLWPYYSKEIQYCFKTPLDKTSLRKRKSGKRKAYPSTTSAIASTSTLTPLGRVLTATQERAGQSPVKNRA